MGLENARVVDAAGIENGSGSVVLTLMDSWTWHDEPLHLAALREKLEAYFDFIEGGEVANLYPDVKIQRVAIDVVFRVPPVPAAEELLEKARRVCAQLNVEMRARVFPDTSAE